MFLKPKGKKLIVLREQHSEFFNEELGIVAAGRSQEEKPQRGEVVAVGPDVTSVKVGEVVYFARWAGALGPQPSKSYEPIILHEDEIDCAFDAAEFNALKAAEQKRIDDEKAARIKVEEESAARLAEARKSVLAAS